LGRARFKPLDKEKRGQAKQKRLSFLMATRFKGFSTQGIIAVLYPYQDRVPKQHYQLHLM